MVRVGAGARPGGFRRPGEPAVASNDEEAVSADSEDGSSGSESDGGVVDEEEDAAGSEITEIDEGQGLHNDRVARTLREKAIEIMERKGIHMDQAEDKIALQIFPRVSTVYYAIQTTGLLIYFLDLWTCSSRS